jgi:cardiolipin synthase
MKKVFLDDERESVALTDLPERMRANFFIRLWESITRLMAPLF